MICITWRNILNIHDPGAQRVWLCVAGGPGSSVQNCSGVTVPHPSLPSERRQDTEGQVRIPEHINLEACREGLNESQMQYTEGLT